METFLVRFNLRQFLVVVGLVALVLGLTVGRVQHRRREWNYHQVSSLAFSPDGQQLAVVLFRARDDRNGDRSYLTDVSRTVALLDTGTLSNRTIVEHDFHPGTDGPMDWLLGGPSPIGFTENGKILLVLDRRGGKIRFWNVSSGSWTANHDLNDSDIVAFNLSSDGKMLTVCPRSGRAMLWDTDSWNRLTPPPVGLGLGISSPNGTYWAFIERQCVQVWNVQDRKLLRTFHEDPDARNRVTCVQLSPDGDTVAVRSSTGLRLCSLSTGQEQQINLPEYVEVSYGRERRITKRYPAPTRGIAFSPDGKLLAAWGEHGLKFFDLSHGWTLQRNVADGSINCLAFSPDGKTYATGDQNGKVAIWDVATGKEIRSTTLCGNE